MEREITAKKSVGCAELEVTSAASSSRLKPDFRLDKRQNAIIGQNYPNPFDGTTTIPIILESNSKVSFSLYDLNGTQIGHTKQYNFNFGANKISVNRTEYGLSPGHYVFTIGVQDHNGTFTQSRKMLVK
ncbi:MAG: T9SS type A sorting domain-containing protein [Flavobacterium sp.]|uniref:T9SS type A sorting domain-containing protein n=1 Tax=Flavobacterium sp. TaxID=239 RepID=UPI0012220C7E|nr:T9SS type A sorting domain-containing protein [Flavobacterium sp.]RZJ67959.1 MAG: T9SS type A sorting domain-containing protein [Flavobacterium sp.]